MGDSGGSFESSFDVSHGYQNLERPRSRSERDSAYYAKRLELAGLRFQRGELRDEAILELQHNVWSSAWQARRYREQIRVRKRQLELGF